MYPQKQNARRGYYSRVAKRREKQATSGQIFFSKETKMSEQTSTPAPERKKMPIWAIVLIGLAVFGLLTLCCAGTSYGTFLFGKNQNEKVSVAPEPTAAPAPTSIVNEPSQLPDMVDAIKYPVIFKGTLNNEPVCGAKEVNVPFPADYVEVEHWNKSSEDGNYLHSIGQFGMDAFCKGTNPAKHLLKGDAWRTILITSTGVQDVAFPLK